MRLGCTRTSLRAAAAALALQPAATAPAQTPPVFRAEVDAVYVDVYVSRRGRPVTGLRAEDFVVLDNGVRQDVRLVDLDAVGTSAVLALDVSGSTAGDRLRRLQDAGRAFVSGLGPADEAALVLFSHDVRLQVAATPDKAALHRALDHLAAEGGTALHDAAYLALTLPRGRRRPLVVLFTDGEDTLSWLDEDAVREAAREADVALHAVVTPPDPAPAAAYPLFGDLSRSRHEVLEPPHFRFLRQLAESTGGRLWTAASDARLEATFLELLQAAKARYVLAYEPRGGAREGRHTLEVKVERRGLDVQARRHYVVAR